MLMFTTGLLQFMFYTKALYYILRIRESYTSVNVMLNELDKIFEEKK